MYWVRVYLKVRSGVSEEGVLTQSPVHAYSVFCAQLGVLVRVLTMGG